MTLADIVWRVVEKAAEYALERIGLGDPRPTREDIERAIIELRFQHMQLVAEQLDENIAQHAREAREAEQRGRELHEQYFETELIEPTGNEPTHRPFKRGRE